jgi:hypothetical protein
MRLDQNPLEQLAPIEGGLDAKVTSSSGIRGTSSSGRLTDQIETRWSAWSLWNSRGSSCSLVCSAIIPQTSGSHTSSAPNTTDVRVACEEAW